MAAQRLPAIDVGARALRDIDASRGRLVGRGSAWVGVILGTIGTIGTVGGLRVIWQQYR